MFVQDREVEIAIEVDSGEATPRVIKKAIWLLHGKFTSEGLIQWVDDIINGRETRIKAKIAVVELERTMWPNIDAFLPADIYPDITQQTHQALRSGICAICEGRLDQGELILRNIGAYAKGDISKSVLFETRDNGRSHKLLIDAGGAKRAKAKAKACGKGKAECKKRPAATDKQPDEKKAKIEPDDKKAKIVAPAIEEDDPETAADEKVSSEQTLQELYGLPSEVDMSSSFSIA